MGVAEAEDSELVAAMDRDPAALEEFYRRHVRPLTRYVARRLGDLHAPDVVASTFLAALESARRFDPERGAAAAWLYGIASNLIGTHVRRAMAEARAVDRLGGQRSLADDDFGRVDDRVDAAADLGPPGQVLEVLPKAERELLTLVLTERLTVAEAAESLGIRAGTARMRLSRARARLLPHLRRKEGDGA